MFIQRIYKKTKTKTYSSVVLMENYREGKKVKHHIISNLSRWPERYRCEGETKTIIPQNLLPHQQQMIDQLELKLR